MLFGGLYARPFPPYLVQYLQPVGFFFLSLFSSRPLIVRLRALRDVVLFRLRGVDGDRDVHGEGERRLCRLYFSFYFHCTLRGAGPLLSVVVAACALSSSLSD